MSIVANGLGQPEQGAIVAAGLGASEPAAPGAISAHLTGTASVTATLTAVGGSAGLRRSGRRRITYTVATPGYMHATLTATASVAADIEFTVNFDDTDLIELLLVGAL